MSGDSRQSREIGAHRFAPTVRSGDSHVIGENGEIRNVDRPAPEAPAEDAGGESKVATPPRPSRK